MHYSGAALLADYQDSKEFHVFCDFCTYEHEVILPKTYKIKLYLENNPCPCCESEGNMRVILCRKGI